MNLKYFFLKKKFEKKLEEKSRDIEQKVKDENAKAIDILKEK